MELISKTSELKGCADAEHNLDSACEDMERLHCLMLDVLMLDESGCLLCTAEEDVHDLLRIDRVE